MRKEKETSIFQSRTYIYMYLAFLLLFIPAVNAEIALEPVEKTHINYGESILIEGTANVETTTGKITYQWVCGENSIVVREQKIIFTNNQASFDASVKAPRESKGTCHVKTELNYQHNNTEKVEVTQTNNFELVNELEGTFTLEQEKLQAGQPNELSGTVRRLDGTPITGLIELFFTKEEKQILVEDTTIVEGTFSYTINSGKLPAGTYTVIGRATNIYGNSFNFDIGSFEINTVLQVEATANQQVKPGENVVVEGTTTPELEFDIDGADVTIRLKDKTYKSTVEGNSFKYLIILPKDIKSGEHDIGIQVHDEFGNSGEATTQFTVQQIPSLIVHDLNKQTFLPKEKLLIVSHVYDQANDPMKEQGTLFLMKNGQEQVKNFSVTSGETVVEYLIPEQATPGQYLIKTVFGELEKEISFTVDTLDAATVTLSEDQSSAVIENTGNVFYNRRVELKATNSNGKKYDFSQTVNLAPGAKTKVILGNELPTDKYSLILPETVHQDEVHFDGVSVVDQRSLLKKATDSIAKVTGFAGKQKTRDDSTTNNNWILPALFLLLVAGLAGSLMYRRKTKIKHLEETHPEDEQATEQEQTEIVEENETEGEATPKENKKESEAQEESNDYVDVDTVAEDIKKASEEPSREDPQVKKYVSETLKRAFPENRDLEKKLDEVVTGKEK